MAVKNGLLDKPNGLVFDSLSKQNRLVQLLNIHMNTNGKVFLSEYNFAIILFIHKVWNTDYNSI